jgi:hypothetical protein
MYKLHMMFSRKISTSLIDSLLEEFPGLSWNMGRGHGSVHRYSIYLIDENNEEDDEPSLRQMEAAGRIEHLENEILQMRALHRKARM